MSSVTNFMILCSYYSPKEINESLKPFYDESECVPFTLVDPNNVGGNCMVEADILIGAINHPDLELFQKCMKEFLKGHNDCEVQVMIMEQHKDYWTLFDASDINNKKHLYS